MKMSTDSSSGGGGGAGGGKKGHNHHRTGTYTDYRADSLGSAAEWDRTLEGVLASWERAGGARCVLSAWIWVGLGVGVWWRLSGGAVALQLFLPFPYLYVFVYVFGASEEALSIICPVLMFI